MLGVGAGRFRVLVTIRGGYGSTRGEIVDQTEGIPQCGESTGLRENDCKSERILSKDVTKLSLHLLTVPLRRRYNNTNSTVKINHMRGPLNETVSYQIHTQP